MDKIYYNIASRIFAESNSITRACFIFPLSMLMTSTTYTLSSCELSNPPKTSPKCIGNSTVHYEALTMCFIKKTLLNLSINSREKRWVLLLLLLSPPQTVRAVVCANQFFALGKFGGHSRGSSNSYASFLLSKLPCMLNISTYARWCMN